MERTSSFAKQNVISEVMNNKQNFVDLDNARVDEQRQVMREIEDADHCPFCAENLAKYHHESILKTGKYWLVTKNQWPYPHTKHHFLIISQTHVNKLSELDPEAGKELIELSAWIEQEFKIPGGGLVLRFGDTNYSAGTVHHLHAQIIEPDIHHPEFDEKPVKVKIGKTKK